MAVSVFSTLTSLLKPTNAQPSLSVVDCGHVVVVNQRIVSLIRTKRYGAQCSVHNTYGYYLCIHCLWLQIGSFVPAESAELSVLDGIYTRMGASDNLLLGRSTFLEELADAGAILQQATAR